MIVSTVESQSTAGLTAITTSTVSADTSDTPPVNTARQPPIGIETAAATNPTHYLGLSVRSVHVFVVDEY